AVGERVLRREVDLIGEIGVRLFRRPRREALRDRGAHERLCVVDEHTRWPAARVLDDAAAGRVGRRWADTRQPERGVVGDERVPAGMFENYRIVRRRLVDEVVGLETLDDPSRRRIPLFLMPA